MRLHGPRWSERLCARNGMIGKEYAVECVCGRYRTEWAPSRATAKTGIRDHIMAKQGRRKKR